MSTIIELNERISELVKRIEKGETSGELVTQLSAEWNVSGRTVERYIAHAKDIVTGNMKKRDAIIEEVRAEVITNEARESLMSNLELEAKLCQIVEGKLEAEKLVHTKEGVIRVPCLPNHKDIILAIDHLWRRRRGYSKPDPAELTGKREVVIVVNSEEEAELVRKIQNQDLGR